MIQIGLQPPSAALAEGPPHQPGEQADGRFGPRGRLDANPAREASDGSVFVSPPPLPFPRVFPGL